MKEFLTLDVIFNPIELEGKSQSPRSAFIMADFPLWYHIFCYSNPPLGLNDLGCPHIQIALNVQYHQYHISTSEAQHAA